MYGCVPSGWGEGLHLINEYEHQAPQTTNQITLFSYIMDFYIWRTWLIASYLFCTANKIRFSVFPEMKLRVLAPNFLLLLFPLSCICERFIFSHNRSQINEWKVLGTRPRSFISGNICFEFSVQWLCCVFSWNRTLGCWLIWILRRTWDRWPVVGYGRRACVRASPTLSTTCCTASGCSPLWAVLCCNDCNTSRTTMMDWVRDKLGWGTGARMLA
jgi:hypothetical protein